MPEIIYRDKTELIRRALFDVQNEVGLGRDEEVYHQAFCHWLKDASIPFESKRAHHLMLGGKIAYSLFPDVVVWGCITVELKAFARRLRGEDCVQLFNYLKRRGDRLGLLANMGLDHVHVDRFVYQSVDSVVSANWTAWDGCIFGAYRDLGYALRDAILSVYDEHQTGYGSVVTNKLIAFALAMAKLGYTVNPAGLSAFRGTDLGASKLDCMLIENKILLTQTALFDKNEFNIHRGLSFMKALNIPFGLAVNFGKRKLEINALSLSSIRGTPLASAV